MARGHAGFCLGGAPCGALRRIRPTMSEPTPPAPPADTAAPAPPREDERGRLWPRLRRLSAQFAPQRLGWALAIGAMIVVALTEPAIPALLKPLLDRGFTAGDLALWLVPAAIVGVFAVRGLAQFAGQYALAKITNDGMVALRQQMFERLLQARLSLFSTQSASQLANTIVYEVQTGAAQLVHALLALMRDGFTVVALLAYLLYLNWKLTLIVIVLVPGVAFIMKNLSRRLYRLTKDSQRATDALAYVVEENVLAHRMVRLHGAQAAQAGRFEALSHALRRLAIKSTIASAAMTPLTQLFSALALSGVVVLALVQGQPDADGRVTVGGFVAFIGAMLMLVAPIRRLSDVANPITRGLAALERGMDMMDQVLPESEGGWTGEAARARGAVELRNVSVRYRDDAPAALSEVSLSVAPGEVLALVGASGSGKTTLVNLLPRFVLPSSGQVLLDGHDAGDWQLQALRAQFALVSQDVVMFNDSVAANVALGAAQIDRQRVTDCLRAANLAEHIATLPQGIDTPLGHNATQLSGGQRQRLAIARALYKDAPVLILDEATSALDTESERLVQQALARVMAGRTTLIIAHRLSTVEHAHRLVVMSHGRIVEQGTHASLLAAGGIYARLHRGGVLAPDDASAT